MNHEIHEHDVVALLEDVATQHEETGAPLKLLRGAVGTVVMEYRVPEIAYEVEFSNTDGIPYAMLPLRSHQLLVLRHTLAQAAA